MVSGRLMLLEDDDIEIQLLNRGPGKGCSQVVRCDALGFREALDCVDLKKARRAALAALDDLAFQEFRAGRFEFRETRRQQRAAEAIAMPDRELIGRMYAKDPFLREIIRRELEARGVLDEDIYRVGLHGPAEAEQQAVTMLLEQTAQENSPNV